VQQASQHLPDGQRSPKLRWPGRSRSSAAVTPELCWPRWPVPYKGGPPHRSAVKTSLQPLGVRLSTVELQTIAKGISVGHPVQLPE